MAGEDGRRDIRAGNRRCRGVEDDDLLKAGLERGRMSIGEVEREAEENVATGAGRTGDVRGVAERPEGGR